MKSRPLIPRNRGIYFISSDNKFIFKILKGKTYYCAWNQPVYVIHSHSDLTPTLRNMKYKEIDETKNIQTIKKWENDLLPY